MNLAAMEKTRMSTAGKPKRNRAGKISGIGIRGFTLIELTIVIFIAGLLLSVTVPVVRDTLLHDDLKTASRKLAATIIRLRNDSVGEYKDYLLMFDLEKGRYWYEGSDMGDTELLEVRELANTLPEDVRILDIEVFGSEKKVNGEAGIRFSRKGYAGYSLIHLSDKSDRRFTLVIEPLLKKVKIMEDYLSFEDIEQKDI